MKCRVIEVGKTILLEKDPTVKERIITGIEEEGRKYSKLSSLMGRILAELTKFKQEAPAPAATEKAKRAQNHPGIMPRPPH